MGMSFLTKWVIWLRSRRLCSAGLFSRFGRAFFTTAPPAHQGDMAFDYSAAYFVTGIVIYISAKTGRSGFIRRYRSMPMAQDIDKIMVIWRFSWIRLPSFIIFISPLWYVARHPASARLPLDLIALLRLFSGMVRAARCRSTRSTRLESDAGPGGTGQGDIGLFDRPLIPLRLYYAE